MARNKPSRRRWRLLATLVFLHVVRPSELTRGNLKSRRFGKAGQLGAVPIGVAGGQQRFLPLFPWLMPGIGTRIVQPRYMYMHLYGHGRTIFASIAVHVWQLSQDLTGAHPDVREGAPAT